ncbi:Coronin-like protein crn1 [Beauveria bassiana]|nr:Coronin-like protein crn1 [Beauveria bassiana]
MAGRFVRASKYRHIFGKPTRKDSCYDNIHISRNAWDTNLIKANPEYLSVNWDSSGGGAFAVIPLNERGKLPDQIPLFRGHTAAVLDTDWHPFNDRFIASASEDGKVFLWEVPEDFTLYTDAEEIPNVAPVSKLAGHSRKVGQVLFNPSAENILASASGDYTIKIWDVTTGQSPLALSHGDIVQSLTWNAAGSLLATTSRDKKIRVWDVRQEKPVHEAPGHAGAKNSRAVWMGEHNRFATTGFSKMSERQIALWEPGNPEPIGGFSMVDSISGNDKFEFLSEYKSPDPQRGIAFVPRRGINVHDNEVMRAYKTVNDSYIEPISFTVPRRAETFQADIFPPATGTKPACSAKEWLDGKTAIPSKIDLESVYEGTAPKEVASDYKAPAQVTPTTPKAEIKREEPKREEPKATAASRASPPSIQDQKSSISNMANRFQDNDEGEDDDADTASSFEDIGRPAQRNPIPVRAAEPKLPTKTTSAPAPVPAAAAAPVAAASAATPAVKAATPSRTPPGTSTPSGGSGVESSLEQIKQLLENQTKIITQQNDKIGHLTQEVELLKRKVGSTGSQDQNERIRQLELELEEARS